MTTGRARAFSPAHITGFFQIFDKGSTGAGVNLKKGMTTRVEIGEGSGTDITINHARDDAPVSKAVIARYVQIAREPLFVRVEHLSDVPVGYGLGMSAAGALSLSLALNECLRAVGDDAAKRIAHLAEIECGTGLGAVIAQSHGGFLLRKKPGDFGEVERLGVDDGLRVVCAFLRPLSTSKIIRDENWRKKINEVGAACMRGFSRDSSVENFISLSRRFALRTGLAKGVERALLKIKDASMAMLGETLFVLTREPESAAEACREFSGNIVISEISKEGARVLGDGRG
ncbi:MAG: pantoate kinase [Candidatus Micrarchaeota archaeon]